MLRFPNPGSTISNLVAIYTAAHKEYCGKVVTLDDIVAATVAANLATSSGYVGAEAISRSTRQNRSLDPLYNQAKMYAEVYRSLGWLHPTENKSLEFTFTLLGSQIVASGSHYLPLLGESAIGICYPSHILTIKGEFNLRPLSLILQTMLSCGGALSRDEIIVGPLCVEDDRDPKCIEYLVSLVRDARRSPDSIEKMLKNVSNSRKIQINTLKNYTRFPIALMRDCGWTEKSSMPYTSPKKRFEVHKLTDKGREVARRLGESVDVRLEQVDTLKADERQAFCFYAHYQMLERSGFDVSHIDGGLKKYRPQLESALKSLRIKDGSDIIFSPFQSLNVNEIKRIFPSNTLGAPENVKVRPIIVSGQSGRDSREHLFIKPIFVRKDLTTKKDGSGVTPLRNALLEIRAKHSSDSDAAQEFSFSHSADTQTLFYPLVSNLFRIVGFQSEYSRPGVNYQRWDACVWLGATALPIEIKSPTEEKFLSTKAIRQAVENKVVLLSRGGLATSREATSLIVGYQIPNERGEMASLIEDIHAAYGIRIGVIDLGSLANLAIRSATQGVTIDAAQLMQLKGFLYV